MSLHAPPEHFVCDHCATRVHVELLCTVTASPVTLLCVGCCGCETHSSQDVRGTVVWPWRGLDDSPSRTRRHQ